MAVPAAAQPKHTVKLNTTTWVVHFQYNETPHNVIVTTGTWGYCDNYADTGLTLAANVSTTTATKITASSAGLEVGMMLLVGTEAMHVSAVSGNVATVQRGALGNDRSNTPAADAVYRYTASRRDDGGARWRHIQQHTHVVRYQTESIGEYSVTYGDTSSNARLCVQAWCANTRGLAHLWGLSEQARMIIFALVVLAAIVTVALVAWREQE